MGKTILVGLIIAICGCCPQQKETLTVEQIEAKKLRDGGFPVNATNVNNLDNGWFTFKLEINGVERQFLYTRDYSYGGNSIRCFTELTPIKTSAEKE